MKLPNAKISNIVVLNLDKEMLIYDLLSNKAFCLNETSTIIYNACDGVTTFADLHRKYGYSDDLIFLALDLLQKDELIKTEAISHFGRLSRREVVRRVGLASLFVLPVISTVIAPRAINAASGQAACTGGSSANGAAVDASGGGIGSNNAAAQAECFRNLDCSCTAGSAINKTIVLCAGASSAQTCVCNGTCAGGCANPGGAVAGTPVDSSGGGIGSDNAAAQAACFSNLRSQCCSGSATNTSITLCAGASSAQTCICSGTCG